MKKIEFSDQEHDSVFAMSITGRRLAAVMTGGESPARHLVVWDLHSLQIMAVRYSFYFDDDQQHSSIHTDVSRG